jgi:phytoene dehydrogenase-like protein
MAESHCAPKVAVVGAGVAGLVCAKELEKAGFDVEVFEAGQRVGGRVQTDIVDGYKLDRGSAPSRLPVSEAP